MVTTAELIALASQYFLNPIGLLAGVSLFLLLLLYLIRPRPSRKTFPSVMFLLEEKIKKQKQSVFRKIVTNPLLLLQLLILLLFTLAIAQPFTTVPETVVADHAVFIIDTSASMHAQDRFADAKEQAIDALEEKNTIILAGDSTRTVLEEGTRSQARDILRTLQPRDVRTNLFDAMRAAEILADGNTVVHVLSDFSTEDDVQKAANLLEAKGATVVFTSVGSEIKNAGMIDLTFENNTALITVKNFNTDTRNFTVRTAGQQRTISLSPGDVTTVTISNLVGTKNVELLPADDFMVDNRLAIVGKPPQNIQAALITNNASKYIRTALDVNPDVTLTLLEPPFPTKIENFDVIFVGNVNPDRILPGTLRDLKELKGQRGIVLLASQSLIALDLVSISPIDYVGTVEEDVVLRTPHPLTKGLTFSVNTLFPGEARDGVTVLAQTQDNTPVIAIKDRVVYYGIVDELSPFKFDLYYPIFWKRILNHVMNRDTLSDLNVRTGGIQELSTRQTVETPDGTTTTQLVRFDNQGFYTFSGKTYAANLLDERESRPISRDVATEESATEGGAVETANTPLSLAPYVLIIASLMMMVELIYLKRRGDL